MVALIVALVGAPLDTIASPTGRSAGDLTDQVELTNRTEAESWLDETMARQLEEHHVPGAAVVIVKDGEVFLAKGYGYADLASQRPVVANETVFSVGSTGKLVTWTATVT